MQFTFRLCLVAFFVLFGHVSHAQTQTSPLPNWLDPTRESLVPKSSGTSVEQMAPVVQALRVPAEFEPVRAVMIAPKGYGSILRSIKDIVEGETGAEVWSVGSNVSCPLDSVWIRDYGPVGIERTEAKSQVALVDSIYRHWQYRRNDDRAPSCIAEKKSLAVAPLSLILDGGNFMVDTQGNLFMTKRTYLWNSDKSEAEVNRLLTERFALKKIYTINYAGYPGEPADGTGHIDMFVKLLADDTVVIAQTEEEPFKTACEEAVRFFKSQKSPAGTPYKIVRLKGWRSGRTWYTYTNSLLVNDVLLMPSYASYEQQNQEAIRAYESAKQGLKVRPIVSDDSITSGGSIHCLTQTVPRI